MRINIKKVGYYDGCVDWFLHTIKYIAYITKADTPNIGTIIKSAISNAKTNVASHILAVISEAQIIMSFCIAVFSILFLTLAFNAS